MANHEVKLHLHTKVVHSKDVEFEVKSNDSKLGTLLISKGNIEWIPVGNSVNKQRLSWEKFSDLMEEEGRTVKI